MKIDNLPHQQQVTERKNTVIVSAFPACGRSTAYDILKYQLYDVINAESKKFSWKNFFGGRYHNPEFPNNYVEYIMKNIGVVDFIFTSSHEDIRNTMAKFHVPYILVYPDESCLAEWVGRCYLRGNSHEYIHALIDNWEKWLDECHNDSNAIKHIVLGRNDYLIDHLDLN